MRVHTGERPYGCAERGCDYAAATSTALAKHMRAVHAALDAEFSSGLHALALTLRAPAELG
jgi:hypothetical protein